MESIDIEKCVNMSIKNIKLSARAGNNNNKIQLENLSRFILKNELRLYNETDSNKDLILHHLNKRYEMVKKTEDVVCSGKNLLYFSVMFEQSYIDLLEICLNSIYTNTPSFNFDIMFITDNEGKSKISELPVISKFNVDYMIVPSVKSAPMASIRKLDIFDYKRINEYGKILFLDADTICIKDLNILFKKSLEVEKFYYSSTPNHLSPRLLSPTHGILYLSDDDAKFLYWNTDVVPFNAGQFMFVNSKRMMMHFDNVRWLQLAWPSEYFYEQGFMNYYFVLKQLTAPLVDEKDNHLITVTYNPGRKDFTSAAVENFKEKVANRNPRSNFLDGPQIKSNLTVSGATSSSHSKESKEKDDIFAAPYFSDTLKQHNSSTVVIHFAATLPSGQTKKEFIKSYADANQLRI